METRITFLNDYFASVEFLRNEFITMISRKGILMYVPTHWSFAQKNHLHYITEDSSYTGIDLKNWEILNNPKSIEITLSSKILTPEQKLDSYTIQFFLYYIMVYL